jgi:TRAP-type C4-dicarboxylate transport system permease small subunit
MIKFIKFMDKKFEKVLGSIALLILSCTIMIQVLLRVLFNIGTSWSEEIAVYSMVVGVFFACSYAVTVRGHVRITIIVDLLPQNLKLLAVVLGDILWAGFGIMLFILCMDWIELLIKMDHISPALGINQKWPNMIVPIGIALMLLRMFQGYYRWFRSGKKGLPL